MDNQELLARIAELEEENARLKRATMKVSIMDELAGKYPFMKEARFVQSADYLLSKLVRTLCFPAIKMDRQYRTRGKTEHCEYPLQTQNMTVGQQKLYIKIVDELLCVLSKYEVLTKQGGTK